MIAMTYIDKRAATIEAMKDYENMKHILASTSQEVKDEYEDIISLSGVSIDGMPKAHNPKAGENKIVSGLDKINVMRERYSQAVEYMKWFKPAWKLLTDDEQFILKEFYMNGNQRSGASARIELRLAYSARQVDRLRHKALEKLIRSLYGR